MKYSIRGKMMIDFDDVIEISDSEKVDDSTLREMLKSKFWHDIDRCIIPDYDVMMGHMETSEFNYKEIK